MFYDKPEFERLQLVSSGVATNFDLSERARQEHTALNFSGFLQVGRPGLYTFYLEYDDGSRLFVGEPSAGCLVAKVGRKSRPATKSFEEALASEYRLQWITVNGAATFAGHDAEGLQLELRHGRNVTQIT